MTLQVPEPIPVEVSDDPAPLRPPPETEFVEAGKLTMGQRAQAHRDRLETGKHVLDIIVERGWVSAEEVAQLREAYGIQAPPPQPVEAAPEPEPPHQSRDDRLGRSADRRLLIAGTVQQGLSQQPSPGQSPVRGQSLRLIRR